MLKYISNVTTNGTIVVEQLKVMILYLKANSVIEKQTPDTYGQVMNKLRVANLP